MTTLESLTSEELAKKILDPAIQEQIDFDIEILIAGNSAGTAFTALKKLEPAISQAKLPADLAKKYLDILSQLKFIALTKLKQDEASEVLATLLLYTLKLGFDILQKIQLFFLFPDKDDFKKVDWLLRSLEANNELLINNVNAADGKQYAGTVGNIIRLYKNSPYFKDGSGLGIANFLANDKNLKLSDPVTKETVREVLSIYEWIRLKASSHSDSLNEEQGNLEILNTTKPPFEPAKPFVPTPAKVFTVAVPEFKPTPKPSTFVQAEVDRQPVAPIRSSVTTAEPEKEMTPFEKRLAQISSQPQANHSLPANIDLISHEPAHGGDLEALKHRLEAPEIKEAPKAKIDLNKIVAAEPKKEAPKPVVNNPINKEIKREVATTELPAHLEPKLVEVPKPKPIPVVPKPIPPPTPKPTPPPAPKPVPPAPAPPPAPVRPVANPRPMVQTPNPYRMVLESLDKINKIEDLKKIEPGHLRQGPIQTQIQLIKTKITNLVKQNHVLPYYAVAAFEQSPLFKIYLQIGSLMMEDAGNDRSSAFVNAAGKVGNNLTLDEFEAVADLRKLVEQL